MHQEQDEGQSNNEQVLLLTQQLQEKDGLLHEKDNEILSKDRQVQDANRALQQKDNERDRLLQQKERLHQEEIASRERQLHQLNEQLKEQEQVTAEIQQTNHSLQRQVEQLQQQLSQQSLKLPQPPPLQGQARGRQLQERGALKQVPVDHKPSLLRFTKMTLNWRDGGKTPFKKHRGAVAVDENVVYFMNWAGEIRCYNFISKKWSTFPGSSYLSSSLAVINGQVTTIGGYKKTLGNYTDTNKLLSLPGHKEIFPPMPTKRRDSTAMTSKEHLIVAGGSSGHLITVTITTTVEVMDVNTLVWSTVACLPHAYNRASGTICGDQLCILGGQGDKLSSTKSVLTCSLTELLQSSSSSSSSSIWHRVADAPAYWSTCAAFNGDLLAVGGYGKGNKPISAIHKYNPTTNSWDLISNMPTARFCSLIAVLPTKEMIVIGGRINQFYTETDIIEIASIVV